MATVDKRPLSAEELIERDRLVAAWEKFKSEHPGVSQVWLAKATGLGTQGLISQYFRGVIPLNLRALLAICAQIEADPSQISPRLAKDIPVSQDGTDFTSLTPAARKVIEAVIRADKRGESANTFTLMLRMLRDDDESIGLLNP
jgi:hypothetical protein